MARLDIERQKRLEPTRIEYAVSRIQELGFEIVQRDNTQIQYSYQKRVGKATKNVKVQTMCNNNGQENKH